MVYKLYKNETFFSIFYKKIILFAYKIKLLLPSNALRFSVKNYIVSILTNHVVFYPSPVPLKTPLENYKQISKSMSALNRSLDDLYNALTSNYMVIVKNPIIIEHEELEGTETQIICYDDLTHCLDNVLFSYATCMPEAHKQKLIKNFTGYEFFIDTVISYKLTFIDDSTFESNIYSGEIPIYFCNSDYGFYSIKEYEDRITYVFKLVEFYAKGGYERDIDTITRVKVLEILITVSFMAQEFIITKDKNALFKQLELNFEKKISEREK